MDFIQASAYLTFPGASHTFMYSSVALPCKHMEPLAILSLEQKSHELKGKPGHIFGCISRSRTSASLRTEGGRSELCPQEHKEMSCMEMRTVKMFRVLSAPKQWLTTLLRSCRLPQFYARREQEICGQRNFERHKDRTLTARVI